MSGILPEMGSRGQGYRNCRRMAINTFSTFVGKRQLDVLIFFLGGGLICT